MHGSEVSIATRNSGSVPLQSKPKNLEPHVILHITSHDSQHHKEWALKEIKSDTPYAQATRITTIEVHRNLLHPSWTRTALTRPQEANHRKTEGNLTKFKEWVNQVLCKVPEDVRLNSRTAVIPMGKLTRLETFSEEYYWFDLLLPTPFAHKLRDHIIHSDFWKQENLFAINLSLLESPVLYKVQPSRAYLNRHPNTLLHDLRQNVLSRPNMGNTITLLGACPRNEVSVFLPLEISGRPRQGARSHEGTLAWDFHSEAHLIVFKPLTGAMILWNDRASTFPRHTPTSPATPPPPPFVPTDAPQPFHTLEPAPTTAESHTGAAPPTGVWAYTRSLHREAAEALKTAISNHQGLVHTPHDNTQKGYTLWWHHPAPEGGLQPPADQPGIGPDLTAIARAVAAMAQQVGAPPQWAPSIIKETAARHNPAFAHFRGRPIHPTLPDLDLPAHDAWAVHILVPHDTAPKTGDATARITKQLPNTALHYDIPTPNVIVTHNTGRDHYYLQATHERSPITVYTFTTYPGLQPPQHHPRPAWKHPLHVAPTPRKRPTHHAPPPADSTALHTARRRAAAQHQSHLLPRINAGPGTITEATHKSTLNLLARKLRPKMALEDTLWIYYGEGRTARVADLRNIIPRHIQRAVGPFTVYAVPHPITAPCTHCNPRCALPCAGALQQPLPTPTYRGGIFLGTVPGDPHPYLLPAADRHHAIPLHLVEHLAVGPSAFQKRPPHTPSDGRPPDEPTHATPGPKRAIALLTLKAEAAIPRDLEGENHLMVEGLTEHVLIAAMYATASASRLWEDRPSPPLAQAAQDAPDTGPTAEDIHQILNMRAPPKTHPAVRPIQLVSWDAMDAPPATTEVHILKHRDTWWTVEWDDHGKVRRATAHAPDGEVPPPPRGGDRLRLAARIPHAPEAAWEALHYALYWAQGAPEGPLPPERTPAWTRHATRYTAHMRRHGAGTGHRLLTWPTDPPDALQEAEEVLGLMTKQVFQLADPVPTSKPDVPAAREHPVFAAGHAPVQRPQGAPPQRGQPAA